MHRERFPAAKNPNPNGGIAASNTAMDRTPGARMNRPVCTAPAFAASPLLRRFVLGTALFLGLALALAPRSPAVHAQEPKSPPAAAPAAPKSVPKSLSITDGHGAEIKIDVGDAPASETAADPAARAGDAGVDAPKSGKPRKHARVTIDGIGTDREFDSFDEFVRSEPELAGMVVAVVALVFLAPVLAIALILWYRMRKARMLNETMLKLAERGVVPSTDALDALAGGKPAAAVAPYYEQAKQIQRRAAWSDLRKGVLMVGFGVALSMYSLLSDREPNGLGLVLLFVGIGFVVLWWFEQRHMPASPVAQGAAPGPGAGTPPGSPPA
jgi:hypothetical protein